MLNTKIARLILIACLLLVPATVRAEAGCAIVYGENWSFLFAAPEKWEVACPVNDRSGVVVALWPEGTPWAKAPGVMYATGSRKNGFSLDEFAQDELARFRVESPALQAQVVDPIPLSSKSQTLIRKLTGDQFGNHEIIAYADGGNVYFVFVLTSRTQETFERLLPSFKEFVSSVSPMTIKFESKEKTPNLTVERDAPQAASPLAPRPSP
jgi:hypothetical protein